MKILFIHNYYPLQASGEDSVVDEERGMLESAGHEVMLFSMKTREGGVLNLLYCGLCAIWNPVAYRKIRGILKNIQPDVVHCHNTFPLISPSVYWACKKEKVPVVQTLHNFRLVCSNGLFLRESSVCEDCSGKRFPWPALKYRCYRDSLLGSLAMVLMLWSHRMLGTFKNTVDRYIVLTDFAKQKFADSGVIPVEKITVKPNFISRPDRLNGEVPDIPNVPYALFVGRLCREKGADVLIEAWGRMLAQSTGMSNVDLLVVGDGPERGFLEAKAREMLRSLQMPAEKIRFGGHLPREQVLQLVSQARFMILPSIWYEGFPMTIVEAFACGTPMIASALGNMNSIIQDGETGVFFKPGDAESLAEKIIWALTHQPSMVEMGVRARQVFDSNYTPEKNLGQLIDIYRSVSG
ncbi:glycosyltransferase family 4 protein [Tichowtungia aerotolerans]|uniref:Glycosyltransferase n=1 Tax=Tichowtungia aerotolerans TaxID=2697043 RepID=A0A6P1MAB1_9BACT|nr:glycosyltransferase family 4 protein [Tichowtungia aerotolerans]QHI68065.1 glycosyltransferase [Tichowtungia aerotolerans]